MWGKIKASKMKPYRLKIHENLEDISAGCCLVSVQPSLLQTWSTGQLGRWVINRLSYLFKSSFIFVAAVCSLQLPRRPRNPLGRGDDNRETSQSHFSSDIILTPDALTLKRYLIDGLREAIPSCRHCPPQPPIDSQKSVKVDANKPNLHTVQVYSSVRSSGN